jgi:hypothetical protein
MYWRHTIRKKDEKVHRYWRLVRSVRVGRRVVQQTVAHLGELDEQGRGATQALARQLIGTPEQARHSLVGWSKLAAETCLGAPVHESSFGGTDILTDGATSTDSHYVSIGLPLVIGISVSGGGYCNVVLRVQGGRVAEVRYIGETHGYYSARDVYCAPIVRSCVEDPPHLAAAGDAAVTGPSRSPPSPAPTRSSNEGPGGHEHSMCLHVQ